MAIYFNNIFLKLYFLYHKINYIGKVEFFNCHLFEESCLILFTTLIFHTTFSSRPVVLADGHVGRNRLNLIMFTSTIDLRKMVCILFYLIIALLSNN